MALQNLQRISEGVMNMMIVHISIYTCETANIMILLPNHRYTTIPPMSTQVSEGHGERLNIDENRKAKLKTERNSGKSAGAQKKQ